MQKKILRVTHVLRHVTETTWPDDFKGLSLDEAKSYEMNLRPEDVVELLFFGAELSMTTTVDVHDAPTGVQEDDQEVEPR